MSALKCLSRAISRLNYRNVRNYANDPTKESPLKGMLDNAASFDDRFNKDWATLPYTTIQQEHQFLDKIDSRETTVILFPGQGTQYKGMARHLCKYPYVNEIYDCASEIVGLDFKNIESVEDINKYAQLSIVVASLACVEILRETRPSVLPSCTATAGFSLGEVTALIFAGAISIEDGLNLVNVRALAMEAASKEKPGGMLTVLYLPEANIKKLCQDAVDHCLKNNIEDPICRVANYLYPQCIVVSGHKEALNFIINNGKAYGVKATKPVKVSGAFHTEYMNSAVEVFTEALSKCKLKSPSVPVFSAVNCKAYYTPKHILHTLPNQIVKPVRWEQLMHQLYKRPKGSYFPRTFEVGPGKTIRSILRKVNAPAWDNSFPVPEPSVLELESKKNLDLI